MLTWESMLLAAHTKRAARFPHLSLLPRPLHTHTHTHTHTRGCKRSTHTSRKDCTDTHTPVVKTKPRRACCSRWKRLSTCRAIKRLAHTFCAHVWGVPSQPQPTLLREKERERECVCVCVHVCVCARASVRACVRVRVWSIASRLLHKSVRVCV